MDNYSISLDEVLALIPQAQTYCHHEHAKVLSLYTPNRPRPKKFTTIFLHNGEFIARDVSYPPDYDDFNRYTVQVLTSLVREWLALEPSPNRMLEVDLDEEFKISLGFEWPVDGALS